MKSVVVQCLPLQYASRRRSVAFRNLPVNNYIAHKKISDTPPVWLRTSIAPPAARVYVRRWVCRAIPRSSTATRPISKTTTEVGACKRWKIIRAGGSSRGWLYLQSSWRDDFGPAEFQDWTFRQERGAWSRMGYIIKSNGCSSLAA